MRIPGVAIRPSVSFILDDLARMAKARNYFEWQSQMVLRELGQRVVEVGCGIGNFTERLLDREIVIALDIEAECIERLQMRYPSQPNLHVSRRDASETGFNDLA